MFAKQEKDNHLYFNNQSHKTELHYCLLKTGQGSEKESPLCLQPDVTWQEASGHLVSGGHDLIRQLGGVGAAGNGGGCGHHDANHSDVTAHCGRAPPGRPNPPLSIWMGNGP